MGLLVWGYIPLQDENKAEKSLYVSGTCSPVLQPEARWGDIWGMGWLNFHARLVREVTRADDKEVHYRSVSSAVTAS